MRASTRSALSAGLSGNLKTSVSTRCYRIAAEIKKLASAWTCTHPYSKEAGAVLTVSKVMISPDLKHATVWVSIWFYNETKGSSQVGLLALQKSAPHLRHLIASKLALRKVPELHFKLDTTMADALHITALLNQAQPDYTEAICQHPL